MIAGDRAEAPADGMNARPAMTATAQTTGQTERANGRHIGVIPYVVDRVGNDCRRLNHMRFPCQTKRPQIVFLESA
jgi:hypothetical protein